MAKQITGKSDECLGYRQTVTTGRDMWAWHQLDRIAFCRIRHFGHVELVVDHGQVHLRTGREADEIEDKAFAKQFEPNGVRPGRFTIPRAKRMSVVGNQMDRSIRLRIMGERNRALTCDKRSYRSAVRPLASRKQQK